MQAPGKPGLHPVLWVAAIAVTLFSLVGIASLTGLIGKANPKPEEVAAIALPPESTQPPAATEAPPPSAQEGAPRAAEAPAKVAARPQSAVAARPSSVEASSGAAPMDQGSIPVALCASCGTVETVRTVQVQGEGTGTGAGAVAGGVLGGVLGNQIGKGTGNTIATIAGAAAGGYAGHQVEKSVRTSTQYQIVVRMDDGRRRTLTRKEAPQWRQGDRVEVGPNGELSAAPPAGSSRSTF